MNRKEAQKRYDLSLLKDPKVKEWEKKKIRQRYGILVDLEEEIFSEELTKENYKNLINFIDSRLAILRQKQIPYETPSSILTIRTMWGFSSYLENDGFWDYSDQSISNRPLTKGLMQEREDLLLALQVLNLGQASDQIEHLWQNYYNRDDKLKELQDQFWSPIFKKSTQRLVSNLVKKSKEDLQQLAKISSNT